MYLKNNPQGGESGKDVEGPGNRVSERGIGNWATELSCEPLPFGALP